VEVPFWDRLGDFLVGEGEVLGWSGRKSLDAEFAEGAEFRRVERATAKAGLFHFASQRQERDAPVDMTELW